MSTKYKHGDLVPASVLADRLDELSGAIALLAKGDAEGFEREFTLRIPAELDRDADLVLSEAAKRLRVYNQIADVIHYPDCWCTTAYPTLLDAINQFWRSEHDCTKTTT